MQSDGSIFYIRIAKGFLIGALHHFAMFFLELLPFRTLELGGIGSLLTILSSDFNIAIQLIIVVTT